MSDHQCLILPGVTGWNTFIQNEWSYMIFVPILTSEIQNLSWAVFIFECTLRLTNDTFLEMVGTLPISQFFISQSFRKSPTILIVLRNLARISVNTKLYNLVSFFARGSLKAISFFVDKLLVSPTIQTLVTEY